MGNGSYPTDWYWCICGDDEYVEGMLFAGKCCVCNGSPVDISTSLFQALGRVSKQNAGTVACAQEPTRQRKERDGFNRRGNAWQTFGTGGWEEAREATWEAELVCLTRKQEQTPESSRTGPRRRYCVFLISTSTSNVTMKDFYWYPITV